MPSNEYNMTLSIISKLLGYQTVVPVIGSGVSTQAANMPNWKNTIESALIHAELVGLTTPTDISEIKELLSQVTNKSLVAAAQKVSELLRAPNGEYALWLKQTFGPPAGNLTSLLLERIVDLPCPVLATTNYDHLLSQSHYASFKDVTWRQPLELQSALREGSRIVHLHGSYEDPRSVVFGVADYDRLVGSDAYKAFLRTLWIERTLLFIGCSFNGLDDPDFSKLLTWTSRVFRGSSSKHYALLRDGTFSSTDVNRFLHEWRIQIVGYGTHYDDLLVWLERVNPDPDLARKAREDRSRKLLGPGSLTGLVCYAIATPQTTTWDEAGTICARFSQTNMLEPESMLVKSLERAIRERKLDLDAQYPITSYTLLKALKKKPSSLVKLFGSNDYRSFDVFLSSIEDGSYYHTIADHIQSTLFSSGSAPITNILAETIAASLDYFVLSILTLLHRDNTLRAILYEVTQPDAIRERVRQLRAKHKDGQGRDLASMERLERATNASSTSLSYPSAVPRRHAIRELSGLTESERRDIFRISFETFPAPFLMNGQVDALFITGVGDYELRRLSPQQIRRRNLAKASKPVASYIYTGLYPVVASLYYSLGLSDGSMTVEPDSFHMSDVDINPDIAAEHNLITLSGGDVNLFTTKVLTEFERKYHIHPPIRFSPPASSESIFSALTSRFFNERDDLAQQNVAFLLMLPNPWNSSKVVLIAAGNKVLGTMATLRLLARAFSGELKLTNHSIYPDVPARVITSVKLADNGKQVHEISFLE